MDKGQNPDILTVLKYKSICLWLRNRKLLKVENIPEKMKDINTKTIFKLKTSI